MSKRAANAATSIRRPLGRRAALEGAGAAGLVAAGVVAGVGGPVSPVRADAGEPTNGGPAHARPERDRVLRAHALTPLTGAALGALRACGAAGVSLVEAFAPRHGGLPFVVELRSGTERGARRAFELVLDDSAAGAPIAHVGRLALLLENRGDGSRPSPEEDARLALRIAASLESGVSVLEALPLTTARERRRTAPFATLHVPLTPGGESR